MIADLSANRATALSCRFNVTRVQVDVDAMMQSIWHLSSAKLCILFLYCSITNRYGILHEQLEHLICCTVLPDYAYQNAYGLL